MPGRHLRGFWVFAALLLAGIPAAAQQGTTEFAAAWSMRRGRCCRA